MPSSRNLWCPSKTPQPILVYIEESFGIRFITNNHSLANAQTPKVDNYDDDRSFMGSNASIVPLTFWKTDIKRPKAWPCGKWQSFEKCPQWTSIQVSLLWSGYTATLMEQLRGHYSSLSWPKAVSPRSVSLWKVQRGKCRFLSQIISLPIAKAMQW